MKTIKKLIGITKYLPNSFTVTIWSIFLILAVTHLNGKWNMATPYGDGYFQTKNIKEFVAEVKEMTDGEIDITVHSGASLFPSPEIFKAVRGGQAEMGELLIANMGNEDPLFNVDNIPFLAVGYPAAKKLWEVSRKTIEKKLDQMGVVLLYAVPWPPQNFYTKESFNDIAFFKGRKLRAYNAITSQMADLLGAAPVTIQVVEIPQAFSTGIVDAMITSGATGVSSQSWDYINYYTEVEAWMPKNMVFINKKKWRRLSRKHRNAMTQAAKKAEARGWKYSEEVNQEDRKTLAQNGIEVIVPNQSMLNDFKKIGQQMTDSWISQTGREGKRIIENFSK